MTANYGSATKGGDFPPLFDALAFTPPPPPPLAHRDVGKASPALPPRCLSFSTGGWGVCGIGAGADGPPRSREASRADTRGLCVARDGLGGGGVVRRGVLDSWASDMRLPCARVNDAGGPFWGKGATCRRRLQLAARVYLGQTASTWGRPRLLGADRVYLGQTASTWGRPRLLGADRVYLGQPASTWGRPRLLGADRVYLGQTASTWGRPRLLGADRVYLGQTASTWGRPRLHLADRVYLGQTASTDYRRCVLHAS